MGADERGRGMTDQVASTLIDEKERLATTLRSIGDGVITTDTDERITLFNVIAEQLTGWTQEQAIGKPLLQVFHIVDHKTRKPSPDPAYNALESGAVVGLTNDTVLISKNGAEHFISSSVAPIRDSDGRATGVALVFRDVTRLRRAEEALKESQQFASNLIDSSLDMIIAVDNDRRITEFNAAAQKAFGYARDEMLGQDVGILYAAPAEAARAQKTIAETGHAILEVRNRRKNGEIFPAFLSASQLKNAQGEPIGVMGVSRDITEAKKAEEQTIRAERLAALGQMATALAHEINNPLQAIRSILDLVLDFPIEAEERENNLRIVRQEIERLSEVAERVINFARPARIPRRAASVSEVLQHTLTLAGKHLQHSHVQVVTDLPDDLPPALIAPEQITQVFLNLILNAIEEMRDGGNLRIALWRDGKDAVASFANDGPAIPADVMPHVFEPFFTTKPEGSGLGLSVSQTLAQQNGGNLSVRNIGRDKGVEFIVRLPLVDQRASGDRS
jgi:PAS domain S-box-containing protein